MPLAYFWIELSFHMSRPDFPPTIFFFYRGPYYVSTNILLPKLDKKHCNIVPLGILQLILNLYLYLLLPFSFQYAMRETWVHSLGWEDPLEKVMATHSSILAGESSWTVEPGGLQSMGTQRVRLD